MRDRAVVRRLLKSIAVAVAVVPLVVFAVSAARGSNVVSLSRIEVTAASNQDCTQNQGHCFTLAAGTTLGNGATNVVPGDTIERLAELAYDATVPKKATISLTTSATGDAPVLAHFTLTIDRCSSSWTNEGTAAAPHYACNGTRWDVLSSASAVVTNAGLTNLSIANGNGKTGSDHLRVQLALPGSITDVVGNAGKTLTATYAFTATGGNGR